MSAPGRRMRDTGCAARRQSRLPPMVAGRAIVIALVRAGAIRLRALGAGRAGRRSRSPTCRRKARERLALITKGGPFQYDRDGVVFGNREQLLPAKPRGYYHEYTVPTPGAQIARRARIVCGGASDRARRVLLHRRPLPVVQEDPRMKLPDLHDRNWPASMRGAATPMRSPRPRAAAKLKLRRRGPLELSAARPSCSPRWRRASSCPSISATTGTRSPIRSRTTTGSASSGCVISLAHPAAYRKAHAADWATLEDILAEAADFWRERHMPFWVFVG